MSSNAEFPTRLYVIRNHDDDDTYLLCYETERECADIEEDQIVGVYELKQVGKIKVNVIFLE